MRKNVSLAGIGREVNGVKLSPEETEAYISKILAECEELRAEHIRVEKEADWLAQRASKEKCPSSTKSIHCENVDPQNCAACWREAARKAVEVHEEENNE